MLWRQIFVKDRERLLLARGGEFSGIMLPGVHLIGAAPEERVETERHWLDDLVFKSVWADYLVEERPNFAARHFTRVETSSTEVAMIYVNGQLLTVMVPAKRMLFWRDAAVVTAEIVDLFGGISGRADGILQRRPVLK